MNELIKTYIGTLQKIDEIADYDSCINNFKQTLIEQKYEAAIFQNV